MGRNGLKWNADKYWQSGDYNGRAYNMLRSQILNMALTRFKWINLPETCDARFLELTLLTQGMATIAKPHSGDYADEWLSLQVGSWQSSPDIYGNPNYWTALGVNGYAFNVTPNNGYFAFDNHLRTTVLDRIDIWVRELVDIIRTMQQNRAHQKVPMIIAGKQEKRLDMTNYVKQVAGGEIMIIADSDGLENIQARAITPPNAMPFIGDKLWANYLNIWNQIYGALGIGNLPFKSERQIEDEVNSQQDPTDLVRLDGLTCRRHMCEKLRANFPDDSRINQIDVVWQSDNTTDNYNMMHNLETLIKTSDGDANDIDTTL